MNDPVGYFLTFRTYGTWLHGDARGSVDDSHNIFGTPQLKEDKERADGCAQRMRYPAMVLTDTMRAVVDVAIRDHCQFRNWELIELAVRTNNVHVLLGFADRTPERVAGEFKSRATRWLRDRGLVSSTARIWADRAGSTRYIWKEKDLEDVATYIRDWQDVAR